MTAGGQERTHPAVATGAAPVGDPAPDSPAGQASEVAGQVADGAAAPGEPAAEAAGPAAAGPAEASADTASAETRLAEATALAEARLADLQRQRADFVNYRRRVERDRDQAALEARVELLSSLLSVLDDIEGARRNDELTGPFAAIADKLEQALGRAGLESYGEVGDVFDPSRHEALLHDGEAEAGEPTCTQVLQRGYRVGDRVIRPARVAVAGSA